MIKKRPESCLHMRKALRQNLRDGMFTGMIYDPMETSTG